MSYLISLGKTHTHTHDFMYLRVFLLHILCSCVEVATYDTYLWFPLREHKIMCGYMRVAEQTPHVVVIHPICGSLIFIDFPFVTFHLASLQTIAPVIFLSDTYTCLFRLLRYWFPCWLLLVCSLISTCPCMWWRKWKKKIKCWKLQIFLWLVGLIFGFNFGFNYIILHLITLNLDLLKLLKWRRTTPYSIS